MIRVYRPYDFVHFKILNLSPIIKSLPMYKNLLKTSSFNYTLFYNDYYQLKNSSRRKTEIYRVDLKGNILSSRRLRCGVISRTDFTVEPLSFSFGTLKLTLTQFCKVVIKKLKDLFTFIVYHPLIRLNTLFTET